MSGVVAAFLEAWDELRVHKLRVLLSLVGVAVAVAAMTSVSAIISLQEQSQREYMEAQAGRPATLSVFVNAGYDETTGQPNTDFGTQAEAMRTFLERYRITYGSRVAATQLDWSVPGGGEPNYQEWTPQNMLEIRSVDTPYAVMHRIVTSQGRWFEPSDLDRLAPALVVNQAMLAKFGVADLSAPMTITLPGEPRITGVVIGVVPDEYQDPSPLAYLLTDDFQRWVSTTKNEALTGMLPNLEMWVSTDQAEVAESYARRDFSTLAGAGGQVEVSRNDNWGQDDYLKIMRLIGIGITAVILGLAALNLLNIALVTLRQRVREIGIRRAFGAASGRVFFGIMLESVLATVVAGVLGVVIAYFVIRNIPSSVYSFTGQLQDAPAFPVDAAVLGLVAATATGALAGIIPGLLAVRIKPIDAIRY